MRPLHLLVPLLPLVLVGCHDSSGGGDASIALTASPHRIRDRRVHLTNHGAAALYDFVLHSFRAP